MNQRTMDEMITYFNQQVDKMDIDRKYKMALLGMITAIGYENKKQERKTGRWVKDRLTALNGGSYEVFRCSECQSAFNWRMAYCGHCGAKMDLNRKEADLMLKALECYKKMAQKVMDWRG